MRQQRSILRNKRSSGQETNVGETERLISLVAGAGLLLTSIIKRNRSSIPLALSGLALLRRGESGACALYRSLGINTSSQSSRQGREITASQSVIINRDRDSLYRYWRNFQALPQFMEQLKSVQQVDARRSHWVAETPGGVELEWDAETTEDRPGERIAWETTGDSEFRHRGEVRFSDAPNRNGTEVRVTMNYQPPLGLLGDTAAKLIGKDPDSQLHKDLERFKSLMESGKISTTETQPVGFAQDVSYHKKRGNGVVGPRPVRRGLTIVSLSPIKKWSTDRSLPWNDYEYSFEK